MVIHRAARFVPSPSTPPNPEILYLSTIRAVQGNVARLLLLAKYAMTRFARKVHHGLNYIPVIQKVQRTCPLCGARL